MAKTVLSSRKLIETFSDPVAAVEQLNLHTKIRDFSVPDLEVNFNNGGVEFVRGSGSVNFKRNSEATYFDTDGIMKRVYIDEPRVEQNGILIEGPSRNYIKSSEDFKTKTKVYTDVADVTNVFTVDGVSRPQKLIEGNSDNLHYLQFDTTNQFPIQSILNKYIGGANPYQNVASNKMLTFSIFVKAAERDIVKLEYLDQDGTTVRTSAVFNLSTGQLKSSFINWDQNSHPYPSHFYRNAPNNHFCEIRKYSKAGVSEFASESWYRLSITFFTGADTANPIIRMYLNNADVNHDDDWIYPGNVSSGIYVWGAQLEPMPYATSYIYSSPNATDIAVREGDMCWISNAAENVPFPHLGKTTYIADFDLMGRYHPVSSYWAGRNPAVPTEAAKYPYLDKIAERELFSLQGFRYHLGRILPDTNLISYYDGASDSYAGPLDASVESDNIFADLVRGTFVHNGTTQYVYVNGKNKVVDADQSPAKTGTPTHIALGHAWSTSSNNGETISGGSNWLNGHISSFRIFRRALDQHELMLV